MSWAWGAGVVGGSLQGELVPIGRMYVDLGSVVLIIDSW